MERKPSGWTSPSSLLGILGFAALVFTGFTQFQKNVEGRVSTLENEVRHLERSIGWLREDLKEVKQERRGWEPAEKEK